jgi:hypothetical protein
MRSGVEMEPSLYRPRTDPLQKPKSRKEITGENYRIEDYLQGLRFTRAI